MAVTRQTGGAPDGHLVFDHGDIVEAPGWFGSIERPLFGWFVYPASMAVRGAVVLCQPIGEEANMTYRTFRTLSQQLARAGFLALRFDYDGTGDSAGSFEDAQRSTLWSDSVVRAVAEVRLWGIDRVSLVGMRLGATIGYSAAAESLLELEDLVLWDPIVSGRSFLREKQMLQNSWIGDRARAPEGWIETPSYRFGPDIADDVRSIAIDGRKPPTELARRITVLSRADRVPPKLLLDALPPTLVDWENIYDQPELLDVETIYATVPSLGVAEVVRLVSKSLPDPPVSIFPRLYASARWFENGIEIEETARFFGSDKLLFGVQTSKPEGNSSRPNLLFLSVSAERHLGEGRMWIRLARLNVGRGFDSLRLDHIGIGDSATRAGHQDDTIFDEDWVKDVPEVARELSNSSVPDVIGVGLCSSGVSALQAASAGAFREVIAINVPLGHDYTDDLPRNWTIFARRPAWLSRLSVKHKRLSEQIWSASSVFMPKRDVLWGPRTAVVKGVDVTLISGTDESERFSQHPLWRATWGRRLSLSGRFFQQTISDADHALRTSSGQEAVISAINERLKVYSQRTRITTDAGLRNRSPLED